MSTPVGDPIATPAEASALPRAYGDAVLSARFRSTPEDFFVDEQASFAATGEGEHLLLTIEKRGMNTAFAAKKLAAWAGIAEMGIGYAGMKDRNACTRQRFSVHFPRRVSPDIGLLAADDFKVLEHSWHNRKLSRGALAGNRFVLVLRELQGDRDAVDARLRDIAQGGIANYFGEQRFGREGDNVESARRMFAGDRVRREQRSIYLSAARSALFNAVLARRIEAGNWNTGVEGDVWMLDGTQSIFGPEPHMDETLSARLASGDIHPTGPMWGTGELRTAAFAQQTELSAVAPFDELRTGLEAAGLRQERRSLRVRVGELCWDWLDHSALQLTFQLAPGAYATELLAELGDVRA